VRTEKSNPMNHRKYMQDLLNYQFMQGNEEELNKDLVIAA